MTRALRFFTVGLFCLLAVNARAASIDFVGGGKMAAVTIHSPVLGDLNAWAGELNWNWLSGEPVGYSGTSFYSYCVDVNDYIQDPETVTVDIAGTNTLNNGPGVTDGGKKAAWLFNTYAASIHGENDSNANNNAAALQAAIWAALYNSTNTLNGNFKLYNGGYTSGYVYNQAQYYLNQLYSGPGGYYTSVATWLDAGAGGGQDQIIANPVAATPEPASLLLFGTGLAGLGNILRRRKRRASQV